MPGFLRVSIGIPPEEGGGRGRPVGWRKGKGNEGSRIALLHSALIEKKVNNNRKQRREKGGKDVEQARSVIRRRNKQQTFGRIEKLLRRIVGDLTRGKGTWSTAGTWTHHRKRYTADGGGWNLKEGKKEGTRRTSIQERANLWYVTFFEGARPRKA